MRVGILTGGGDAPGLNAVVRAFVKRSVGQLGWEVWGVHSSFGGLLRERRDVAPLSLLDCRGLLSRGGTILGTTNRGDLFAWPTEEGPVDRSADVAAAVDELGLDGLVCLGGDGTQAMAERLMRTRGVPVVGVPKTIDNDLRATDRTFGFSTAVAIATEALDRLHTTAESHDRVILLELMGRDAGHIALDAGIAGGADVILLPELPYNPAKVAAKIHKRRAMGRTFSLVVVAEGALPITAEGGVPTPAERRRRLEEGGGAARIAQAVLAPLVASEMRAVVLGHLQRGGSPIAEDRLLASRFGLGAVDLVEAGRWGEMVALRGDAIVGIPLTEVVGGIRAVDPNGERVQTARRLGIELGA